MSEKSTGQTAPITRSTESLSNLRDALDRAAESRHDTPALSYFDTTYSYGQVQRLSQALATYWQDHGIRDGDRILVQLQNLPQFVFAAFAAWELGAIIVPVSPMYRAREIRRIAGDSGAVAWLTEPAIAKAQGQDVLQDSSLHLVMTTTAADFGEGVPERFVQDPHAGGETVAEFVDLAAVIREHAGRVPERGPIDPGQAAVLTYTSGTTGPPKGAMNTHGNLVWAGQTYPESIGVTGSEQVILALAPLVHITGIAMHIASGVVQGCQVVLGYRFDPAIYLDLMERQRVTWTTGTSTAHMALMDEQARHHRDLSSLQTLASGGAAIPAPVLARVKEVYGVDLRPGYGMTEVTGASHTVPAGANNRIDPESGITSVGPPIGSSRVQIVDPLGNEMSTGERGEVLLRGPGVVPGYWNNQEADQTAYDDGWLRSGDIGFVDEDGWLFIVDRTKNMIVASGYKVWPREVEDVLYGHPAVREVAVIGLPDEYRGETVAACLSLTEQGAAVPWDELTGQLTDYCRESMAAYKVPRRFVLREELPKNFNGKIQHRDLKSQLTEG